MRTNTNDKHRLEVVSQKNFEVNELLRFTIEPRCTLEEIPFVITHQNGKLEITKT